MKKFSMICLTLILMMSVVGCGKKESTTEVPVEDTVQEAIVEEEQEEIVEETELIEPEVVLPQEVPEGMAISYLTGEYIKEELVNKRPVAVMISNIKGALPSSSTSQASIIYEAPVEGGITRLMAVFEDYTSLEKVGSVRSCRDYFLDYAMNFDCIYVHYGQAVYALEYLNSTAINNLNGMDGYGEQVFYRTSDRKSPHNAYTSGDGILYGIDYKDIRTELKEDYQPQFSFVNVGDELILKNGTDVSTIIPGYFTNDAKFEYNPEDGLYYRYEYGDAQNDEYFNTQLAVKNVIIQVSGWRNYDENGYLNMYTQDGGKCMYFTNGKMIEGTWTRSGKWGHETYYDLEGNEIVLNTGKTWVSVVQDSYMDRIQLS